jgi:hypothetical protein
MLTSLCKAAHEVTSQADTFLGVIDQQLRFSKKRLMSEFFSSDDKKIRGPDRRWFLA